MLSAGALISGRYRLVRLLGEGGMGTVWAAVNEAFGRNVAVKIMLRQVAADPTALERFLTEARICGQIRHPGIVDVLDVGRTEDGSPFLVMEMLEGEPLDGLLRRTGTLRPLDLLPVVRDVARTIALAHERGVIHRDIKPANIFLHRLPNGQIVAKVLDFGISKVTRREPGSATLTNADTLVGSPAYMSPEQAAGRLEIDARSDVYGLGVILYEALSGRLPFPESNYNALIIDVAVKEPPPLSTLCASLPKPVLELVAAAMAHDREQRIPSAAALADRIEATIAALGASASLALPDPASLGRGSSPGPVLRSGPSARAVVHRRRSSNVVVGVLVAAGVIGVGAAALALKGIPAAPKAGAASSAVAEPGTGAAPPASAPPPSAPPSVVPAATTAAPPPTATVTAAPTPTTAARKAQPVKKKEKGGAYGFD